MSLVAFTRTLNHWQVLMLLGSLAMNTGCDVSPRAAHGPRTTSYAQLYEVGLAIRDYRNQRGELPSHFSDLVPVDRRVTETRDVLRTGCAEIGSIFGLQRRFLASFFGCKNSLIGVKSGHAAG